MVDIQLSGDAPVYQQIIDRIREDVAAGRLMPGEQLTTVRQLAVQLGVNPSTVARAYRQLEAEGIIETNTRRGSVVARSQDKAGLMAVRAARLHGLVEHALVEALAQGYRTAEVEAAFGLQLAAWRERQAQIAAQAQREVREKPARVERLRRFVGSHDLALEALFTRARRANAELAIEPSFVGSLDGLLALLHGEAGLAGAHILDEKTGEYNLPILQRLFVGQSLCVITLAEREQGLMVPRGNPRHLTSFADLSQSGLRFINRQPGSGTRTLLDFQLRRCGIASQSVTGYGTVAATHLAVARAVAEGNADTGLGLYAAAAAFDLDFVPLAHERYHLVLLAEDRHALPLGPVIEMIRTPEFREVVAGLGGYETTHTGEETVL